MKSKILSPKRVLFAIALLSICSFVFLNQISADPTVLDGQMIDFSMERAQVKEFLPDLFVLDNLIDKLKDIITIDI